MPWTANAQVAPGAPRPAPLEVPAPVVPQGGIELRAPRTPGEAITLPGPVFVKVFRIVGATVAPESELIAVLAPWMGRVLDAAALNEAANAVTSYLRGKGLLVAQTYVPAQQIRDGVVELAVAEGRIGLLALILAGDTRLRRPAAERFIESIQPGDTIRSDNVERSLLLLNDLPGLKVAASLAPGASAGTADVNVAVENDGAAVAGALVLDNAGIRAAGQYRADAHLRLRSPLGIGDLLAARLLQSSEGGQTLASLTYGLPVNGLGTRLGLRYSAQRYRLGREFTALDAHGESHATSLLASHPLVRASDRNLLLSASYTLLDFADRQDAVGFASDSKQRIAGIGLAGDLQDRWLGGGVSAFQAQYLLGRLSLETPALAALDAGPGGLQADGRFAVLRLRAQRAQTIDARSSLHLSVTVQRASKNLDAGTELGLGGPDAVRAYPAGELYADEGYLARIEYRYALDLSDNGQKTTLAAFFDDARARINRNALPGDPANKRALRGYGLGIYHELARNVALQSWLAWRAADRPVSEADRSPRVWLSIATQF